ncbi:MAG: hypothetical protein JSV27_05505 [Candidatus Bathyarchaeota archaeon]|nr:MAG: hypothetical protein JSV27_05505 [Candidatus Bathyarchaeota archaeon]
MTRLLREETQRTLVRHGIQLDPALDEQHLVDPLVIDSLIENAEVGAGDTTLEIGAGLGNITVPLAARSGRVVAVEKNPKFIPPLVERTFTLANVEIINDNALAMRLPCFTKLVSNLPYSICEAVLNRLTHTDFNKASLIVSSTFANTITADPGNLHYSHLTLVANTFYEIDRVQEIEPGSYHPPSGVSTSMITLSPREAENRVQAITHRLLLHEGMKLRNALRESLISTSSRYGGPSTKREARLRVEAMNLSPIILEKRVARLSLNDLRALTRALHDHI